MNAENQRTLFEDCKKPQVPEATAVDGEKASKAGGSPESDLSKTLDSAASNHCEFVPELPFPWNGAFLEWQKELRNSAK